MNQTIYFTSILKASDAEISTCSTGVDIKPFDNEQVKVETSCLLEIQDEVITIDTSDSEVNVEDMSEKQSEELVVSKRVEYESNGEDSSSDEEELCPVRKIVTVRCVDGSHNHRIVNNPLTYHLHRKLDADIFEEAILLLQKNKPSVDLEMLQVKKIDYMKKKDLETIHFRDKFLKEINPSFTVDVRDNYEAEHRSLLFAITRGCTTKEGYEEAKKAYVDFLNKEGLLINKKTCLEYFDFRSSMGSYYANKHPHMNNRSTNRVEGTHSAMKGYIGSSKGKLGPVTDKIDEWYKIRIFKYCQLQF
ncbi:hypothetical protein EDC96DRAFT_540542 [Choanephora cucurbitarum]|nr:hypothetical protein EDC96DRAFT_540542 [Choanephora cucurbitarum]